MVFKTSTLALGILMTHFETVSMVYRARFETISMVYRVVYKHFAVNGAARGQTMIRFKQQVDWRNVPQCSLLLFVEPPNCTTYIERGVGENIQPVPYSALHHQASH